MESSYRFSDSFHLKSLVFRDSNSLRCLSLSVKEHLVGTVCVFPLPWLVFAGVIRFLRSLNELILPPDEQTDEMESIIPLRLKETSDVTSYRIEVLELLLQ